MALTNDAAGKVAFAGLEPCIKDAVNAIADPPDPGKLPDHGDLLEILKESEKSWPLAYWNRVVLPFMLTLRDWGKGHYEDVIRDEKRYGALVRDLGQAIYQHTVAEHAVPS